LVTRRRPTIYQFISPIIETSTRWAYDTAASGEVSPVTAASLIAFAQRAEAGGYNGEVVEAFAATMPEGVKLYPYWVPVLCDVIARHEPVRVISFSVPRSHGKTLLAALLAGWVLRDPDEDKLVVSAATALAQARLSVEALAAIHYPADGKSSPWRARLSNTQPVLRHGKGRFLPVARDPRRADGITPALVLADEAARLEGEYLSRLMTAATKTPEGRLLMTTTADDDLSLPWAGWRQEAEQQLLDGRLRKDWAVHHWASDAGADIHDPRQWRKANPQLWVEGGHITEASIRSELAFLGSRPSGVEEFRTQRLNLPGGSLAAVGIDPAVLERARFDWKLEDMTGRRAWAFIDFSLGSVVGARADLTSVAVVVDGGEWGLLRTWSFTCGELDAMRQNRPWLHDMVQRGEIHWNDGQLVDFDAVESLMASLKGLQLEAVGVDEVGWTQNWVRQVLIERLNLPVEARSQSLKEQAPAWATFVALLRQRALRFHDDPVLLHQLRHAETKTYDGGLVKLYKRDGQNIDALVAACNAARLYELRGRANQWIAPSGVMTI
jgi:phage terminase large subunit-like protein